MGACWGCKSGGVLHQRYSCEQITESVVKCLHGWRAESRGVTGMGKGCIICDIFSFNNTCLIDGGGLRGREIQITERVVKCLFFSVGFSRGSGF